MITDRYSYWEETAFAPASDVVIAGAGFAGLWTAYHLKQTDPSLKILIAEKNVIPSGASTRNAGFACFGSLTELVADKNFFGEAGMMKLVKMRYDGLQQIQKTFPHEEIGYEEHGGYELISTGHFLNQRLLVNDISTINELLFQSIGKKDVFQLDAAKLQHFAFAETEFLIKNRLEGQLHSGKLVERLINLLRAEGVTLLTGVEIEAYEPGKEFVTLKTNVGLQLKGRQFLIANNALASRLSDSLVVTPARGQLLLTSPIPDLKIKGCFHFDEGYYYFRDLEGRILLGGAGNKAFAEEESTDHAVTAVIQEELERFLKEIVLPGVDFSIERRWSGIMGMAENKFPLLREIEPNVFCAVGMGGIGIAVAPVVGEQAARMMRNQGTSPFSA